MNKSFQLRQGVRFEKGQLDKTGIIISDLHIAPHNDLEGGHDPAAWSCLEQAFAIVKPDFHVYIGDVGEWSSVNHYQWAKKQRPLLRDTLDLLDRDALEVNCKLASLNTLAYACGSKEIHFIQGNHELWIDNLCAEVPQIRKDYLTPNLLKLNQQDIHYHPHGRWVKFGKLYLTHGTQAKGVNHARAMLLNAGVSCMYGHTHDVMTYQVNSVGGFHKAWCIGCMANLDKPFLKGNLTNWSHAFAILHLHRTGHYTVEMVDIIDGVCWIYGQKVIANEVVKSKTT